MGDRASLPDLVTVLGIALVAYAAANVLHEAAGHGGACLLLGGKALVLSSFHFECGDQTMSVWGRRGVAAGGTIVNLLTAFIALAAFKATDPQRQPHRAYFLWLFTTLNFLMAAGYFLFSGVGNIGDWADVARGTMSPLVWRPALALFGGALYFVLARRSAAWLGTLVGGDPLTMARAARVTLPPYLAGGILYCVSGLFNPVGPVLIAISAAAASFGGASGLVWLIQFLRARSLAGPPADLGRSPGWIVAGAIAAIVFVAILGPSLHL
jgi:hypothetical protein